MSDAQFDDDDCEEEINCEKPVGKGIKRKTTKGPMDMFFNRKNGPGSVVGKSPRHLRLVIRLYEIKLVPVLQGFSMMPGLHSTPLLILVSNP